MAWPQVDVVVVSYNHERFIGECLDSILQQDYPNIRIIVTDDCSLDATQEVVKGYLLKYPDKISAIFAEKNAGITGNCNKPMDRLTGQFLCMIAGDDLMRKDRVRLQVEALLANPKAAGCMSDVQIFYSNLDPITGLSQALMGEIYHNKDFASEKPSRIIGTYNQIPSSALMTNRYVFKDYRYDERTPVVSDWVVVNQVAQQGMVYISQALTLYRRHPSNTTGAGVEKIYLDDRLISTDILLSRSLTHYFSIRRARAQIFLGVATRYWAARELKECFKFLSWSALEAPLNLDLYRVVFLTVFRRGWKKISGLCSGVITK